MDCASSNVKIAFVFQDVFNDGPAITEPWQVYLRIVGTFQIEVYGVVLYTEEQFCLVEFAIQAQIWSRAAALEPKDFTYTSLEAEEPGLVWFRMEHGGWKIGSVFQREECKELFSFGEIAAALDDYYARLRQFVNERFRFDIVGLFDWPGVRGSGEPQQPS